MSTKIINIPDLGEAEDVEVIEICVKEGDKVNSEAPILVLESDKAAMEIPASIAGTVISLKVSLGDKVGAGTPFLEIEAPEEIRPLKEEVTPLIESETSKESEINHFKQETNLNTLNERSTPSSVTGNSSVYAGPAVRKLAREFGIQLSLVNPSGPRGRIQKEDLHLFVKGRLSGASKSEFQFSQPNVDYSKWGPVEEHQLTRFQKSSLTNLHTSWVNIPHVTQHDECDLGLLLDLRSKLNKKHQMNISLLAFIAKIISNLLYEFPLLNSSLDQELKTIIVKNYVNLGIAVDTPEGLIVPNIKNTQDKSIVEIANEISMLATASKSRKLKLDDLKGASFSVSSLGAMGGKFFTPIINPPEVGILGLSRTFRKVIENNKNFEGRDYLPISLSYDHRVINGVYAVQFTSQLGEALLDSKLIEKSFI